MLVSLGIENTNGVGALLTAASRWLSSWKLKANDFEPVTETSLFASGIANGNVNACLLNNN